ncbi:MAG: Protein-L-isoaspartate O-methyltransferase [uncultured Ramlibacter sp.]|uniref:Protein-L-isoaspartate O-methyltransferase n=1 Tax=uncultured Ramlibacter sp. TaxID=260755 RepID=A0A6J4PG96_9BURK|nr:MAG: Protein-L-isoaspartate O-methyltransferase [uncultured Ramlibacter sp.]
MTGDAMLHEDEVRIQTGSSRLYGDLVVPEGAGGLVLFVHGSGSGRHSARNRRVAHRLHRERIATLLFDLLTPQEEQEDLHTRQHRFDIALLTRRLEDAATWALQQAALRSMKMGYFGASTGSAAALIAAARLGSKVAAVVSRGGRPDLAGPAVLEAIRAPTLLIVGEADHAVMNLNQQALARLGCERRLAVVPGATHLFEEPGALDEVANLAAEWFGLHLARSEQHA